MPSASSSSSSAGGAAGSKNGKRENKGPGAAGAPGASSSSASASSSTANNNKNAAPAAAAPPASKKAMLPPSFKPVKTEKKEEVLAVTNKRGRIIEVNEKHEGETVVMSGKRSAVVTQDTQQGEPLTKGTGLLGNSSRPGEETDADGKKKRKPKDALKALRMAHERRRKKFIPDSDDSDIDDENAPVFDAAHSALLTPVKDVAKTWQVDIQKELSGYFHLLRKLKFGGKEFNMNFAEAALLVQNTTSLYLKKMDQLHEKVMKQLELLWSKGDAEKKKKKSRYRKAQALSDSFQCEFLCDITPFVKTTVRVTLTDEELEAQAIKETVLRRVPLWLMPREEGDRKRKEFKIQGCTVHRGGTYLLLEQDLRHCDLEGDDMEIDIYPQNMPPPPDHLQNVRDQMELEQQLDESGVGFDDFDVNVSGTPPMQENKSKIDPLSGAKTPGGKTPAKTPGAQTPGDKLNQSGFGGTQGFDGGGGAGPSQGGAAGGGIGGGLPGGVAPGMAGGAGQGAFPSQSQGMNMQPGQTQLPPFFVPPRERPEDMSTSTYWHFMDPYAGVPGGESHTQYLDGSNSHWKDLPTDYILCPDPMRAHLKINNRLEEADRWENIFDLDVLMNREDRPDVFLEEESLEANEQKPPEYKHEDDPGAIVIDYDALEKARDECDLKAVEMLNLAYATNSVDMLFQQNMKEKGVIPKKRNYLSLSLGFSADCADLEDMFVEEQKNRRKQMKEVQKEMNIGPSLNKKSRQIVNGLMIDRGNAPDDNFYKPLNEQDFQGIGTLEEMIKMNGAATAQQGSSTFGGFGGDGTVGGGFGPGGGGTAGGGFGFPGDDSFLGGGDGGVDMMFTQDGGMTPAQPSPYVDDIVGEDPFLDVAPVPEYLEHEDIVALEEIGLTEEEMWKKVKEEELAIVKEEFKDFAGGKFEGQNVELLLKMKARLDELKEERLEKERKYQKELGEWMRYDTNNGLDYHAVHWNGLPELYERVESWEDAVLPILEEDKKKPEFNFGDYTAIMLDELERRKRHAPEKKDHHFDEFIRGQPQWEVGRQLLTSLVLANHGNVQIKPETEGGEFVMELISTTTNDEAMAHAFGAITEKEAKAKAASAAAAAKPGKAKAGGKNKKGAGAGKKNKQAEEDFFDNDMEPNAEDDGAAKDTSSAEEPLLQQPGSTTLKADAKMKSSSSSSANSRTNNQKGGFGAGAASSSSSSSGKNMSSISTKAAKGVKQAGERNKKKDQDIVDKLDLHDPDFEDGLLNKDEDDDPVIDEEDDLLADDNVKKPPPAKRPAAAAGSSGAPAAKMAKKK
ncbi:unnamed protein product [Amoebophrya sp. A120]|nr:unnamed protein product [Amoebophrya sp. A120]|eukprot:GSA120T00007798001.1